MNRLSLLRIAALACALPLAVQAADSPATQARAQRAAHKAQVRALEKKNAPEAEISAARRQ